MKKTLLGMLISVSCLSASTEALATPIPPIKPLSESVVKAEISEFPSRRDGHAGGDLERGREIFENIRLSETPWEDIENLNDSDADSLLVYANKLRLTEGGDRYIGEDSDFVLHLNEKIACVRQLGAKTCWKAAELAKKAQRDAEFRFAGRMHNGGPGDAFRHCWWSASMTTDINENAAKIIGDNHEFYSTSKELSEAERADRKMDLFNNAQGRWAAVASGYKWQVAVELCQSWANEGILRVNVP